MAGPNRLRPVEVLRAKLRNNRIVAEKRIRTRHEDASATRRHGQAQAQPSMACAPGTQPNPWMVGLSPPRRHDGLAATLPHVFAADF